MQNSTPDVAQQLPAGGGVSTPASGEYGEAAAEERLQAQLPGEPGADQEAAQTALPPMGGQPPVPPPANGLPRSLFAPTRQPSVPASAPLSPMGEELESSIPPGTRQVLELLAQNRNGQVSRTTQRWALMLLESQDSE
jgi:hypothetical protein